MDLVDHIVAESQKSLGKSPIGSLEASKLAKAVSSELNAVKFDDNLLLLISDHIIKALSAFKARVLVGVMKYLIQLNHDAVFSITGAHPGSTQMQKIEAVNAFYTMGEFLWSLIEEFDNVTLEKELEEIYQVRNISISNTPMG
jgi:hypothetical protein